MILQRTRHALAPLRTKRLEIVPPKGQWEMA